ncbi:MAG: glycosyltransferase family 2 protein [Candidatus Scalindua sp.]|nr:glycosyltransferase family 2 protein [Candidatus Scalindua sp.]
MSDNRSISIIIPCRNEEKFIGECLNSLIDNAYGENRVEILVVDGMSDDGTRAIIKKFSEMYPFIKLFDNPKRVTPVALNIGVRAALGEYVTILGSHSKVDHNFIKINIDSLSKFNVDCVGGVLETLPSNSNLIAQSIALATSHMFGVGNAYFRTGADKPKHVDTVPFGCYKREVFEKIGLFDEDLVRNQDDEFNLRLIKNGGKVLLVPGIKSYYVARDSLSKLWKMYYQYGYFKPLVARKVGGVLTWRQLMPSIFIISLITFGTMSLFVKYCIWLFLLIITLYLFINFAFSFSIALRKGKKKFFPLIIVFSTLHFSYGLGYLKGIFDFIVFKKYKKQIIVDVPLTR